VLLITLILISLHCTSGVVPKTNRIDIAYIGSIYEDINQENPVSAGLADFPGIKIAHTMTEPAFLEHYLYRAGLAQLLNELEIDFVIGDTVVRNQKFFGIPKSMGYAIINFEGIRFTMFSTSKDSLTIDDQVQLTLVRERSDILWVIDQTALNAEPTLIIFYINNRALSDTSMSPIKAEIDTSRHRLIKDFRSKVEQGLNRKIFLAGRVDEHLFSNISERHAVNIIVYPEDLFIKMLERDSTTLRELIDCIAFKMKFKKTEMNEDEISEFCAASGFLRWGNVKEENYVLLPDEIDGRYIYDFYYTKE
jgi:hypothetical protein